MLLITLQQIKKYRYVQNGRAEEIKSLNDFPVLLDIAFITVFLMYQTF